MTLERHPEGDITDKNKAFLESLGVLVSESPYKVEISLPPGNRLLVLSLLRGLRQSMDGEFPELIKMSAPKPADLVHWVDEALKEGSTYKREYVDRPADRNLALGFEPASLRAPDEPDLVYFDRRNSFEGNDEVIPAILTRFYRDFDIEAGVKLFEDLSRAE